MIVARCLNCSWKKSKFEGAIVRTDAFIWCEAQNHAEEFDHDLQIGEES